MINTLRAERIKLLTVRVHWILVAIAVLFPITVVTLVAIFSDIDRSADVTDLIAGLTVVSMLLIGTTATISLTSEYSHDTIRPTYAATPSRLRVISAKIIVTSAVGAVLVAVIAVICWIIASIVIGSGNASISLGDDGVLAALSSLPVLGVLVTWFGLGLGLIIRNSPATISIFLLWPLMIEGLIGLLLSLISDGAPKYLPYGAALSATAAQPLDDVLGRPMGLVLFAGVTLALIAIGTAFDERRDA